MAERDKPQESKDREKEAVEERLKRSQVRSRNSIALASGARLDYFATCEFMPVLEEGLGHEHGEPSAAVFTVAYELEGATPASRPVCFAFNGGPGSCSVWLHLGALGPKRVVVNDDGSMPPPPYAVTDNPMTWFAHFDLVFIDPPDTGWSITAGDKARQSLLSVDGDVAALTQVICAWLTRHKRWGSKLYLVGESYGTTRGAALADSLLNANAALAGLVLVSCAMDLQTIVFSPKNLLPYATFLPAFATVAQFHGRLEGELAASPEAAHSAAKAFVDEDYVRALHAGTTLGPNERERIAGRLSELTGLPVSLIAEKNLRIDDRTFFVELLRDEGLQVGRLDARSTAPMAASRGRAMEFDPAWEAIAAPYGMAAQAYFSESLGMVDEQRYVLLNMETCKSWQWNRGGSRGNAYCATSEDLARALRRNAHLRVFVASGRYDLGTPYSATDWSLAQLDAPPDVLARVEHHYYDAGHMIYTRQADLEKLSGDLATWLGAALHAGDDRP